MDAGHLHVVDEIDDADDDRVLNAQHVTALSQVLGDKWQKLAKHFSFSEQAITSLKKKAVVCSLFSLRVTICSNLMCARWC